LHAKGLVDVGVQENEICNRQINQRLAPPALLYAIM
jgi:hypothetical protein